MWFRKKCVLLIKVVQKKNLAKINFVLKQFESEIMWYLCKFIPDMCMQYYYMKTVLKQSQIVSFLTSIDRNRCN